MLLHLVFTSCARPPEDPPANCGAGDLAVTGVYDVPSNACIVDPSVEAGCAHRWAWWYQPGCPTFETYVRRARPKSIIGSGTNGYGTSWGAPTRVTYAVTRCDGRDEQPFYDVVVTVDGRGGDEIHTTEVAFDGTGTLRWIRLVDFYQGITSCCLPSHQTTEASGWGTPVRYDCTDGTAYTPADFPDTGTGDTADTGATCR